LTGYLKSDITEIPLSPSAPPNELTHKKSPLGEYLATKGSAEPYVKIEVSVSPKFAYVLM